MNNVRGFSLRMKQNDNMLIYKWRVHNEKCKKLMPPKQN